ncbi:hypothetical protein SynRS9902_02319 [Synechococcus sp. RS9902]|nr:hypothetical protein SynRS9902_02319 [Synechococcus sp. RS9902]
MSADGVVLEAHKKMLSINWLKGASIVLLLLNQPTLIKNY